MLGIKNAVEAGDDSLVFLIGQVNQLDPQDSKLQRD